ncbi:MAG: hypothetical protein V4701_04670 [Pseudomonadota bacterium]
MKSIVTATLAASALLCAGSAWAQARTLDSFVTEANRVPLNPTSALRSDARRLMGEANTAFRTVGAEVRTARAAGRTPPFCPPERMSVNPRQLLAHLNAIPQTRRVRMSPTDGIRSWLVSRYPCPAA